MNRALISFIITLLTIFMVSCITGPENNQKHKEQKKSRIHGNWKVADGEMKWIGNKNANNKAKIVTKTITSSGTVFDTTIYTEPDSSLLEIVEQHDSGADIKITFIDSTLSKNKYGSAIINGSVKIFSPFTKSEYTGVMKPRDTYTEFNQYNKYDCSSSPTISDSAYIEVKYESLGTASISTVYLFDANGIESATRDMLNC